MGFLGPGAFNLVLGFPSVFTAREMLLERERESLIRNKMTTLTHLTKYGLQLGYDLGTAAATAWGVFKLSLIL